MTVHSRLVEDLVKKPRMSIEALDYWPIISVTPLFYNITNRSIEFFWNTPQLQRKNNHKETQNPGYSNLHLFEIFGYSKSDADFIPLWICLHNTSKNSMNYSKSSYSKFQLFEVVSCPRQARFRLKIVWNSFKNKHNA